MNENKFCFISCVNSNEYYSESLEYINSLIVPEGYEVEILSIEGAESMTSGYNAAMKSSDAKYKIYLHQDTFIVNKNFLLDLLLLFKVDSSIGMIGMIGCKRMPLNGIWWESTSTLGEVYESSTDKCTLLKLNNVESKYEEAQGIDGFIMITQYDISWREDIFDGWHFYDVSQSIEFKRKGYKTIIPKQLETWCVHDCGIVKTNNGYNEYRNLYLKEYSKDIFPLVSILIPTYNRPDYFKLALESVLNQSYLNLEIIVGDDSTNELTKELMTSYLEKYENIKYIFNEGPLGEFGMKNIENIYSKSKGEYINILMDDDLFSNEKIEKMMKYYLSNPEVTLVTSYRQPINQFGEKLNDISATVQIAKNDTIFSGTSVARALIVDSINFIGEPTTTLVSKRFIDGQFGTYLGHEYRGIIDTAQWLQCCLKGNICYISEPLSFFRLHSGQNQRNVEIISVCIAEQYRIIKDSSDNKCFELDSEEIAKAYANWYSSAKNFVDNNQKVNGIEIIKNQIEEFENNNSTLKKNVINME